MTPVHQPMSEVAPEEIHAVTQAIIGAVEET
jgi:hypothetical protein